MLYVIFFITLSGAIFLLLQDILAKRLVKKTTQLNSLLNESARRAKEKLKFEEENALLNKRLDQTIELYEVTKDICKSLEEEKVFKIFRDNLKKYIGVHDCRYIKDNADLIKYKDYMIFPLVGTEESQTPPCRRAGMALQPIAYLAIDKILDEDKDKLLILAQQFLIGLRRAILYQKVSDLAITDTLTQVYSRRYFLERFNEELRRSKKNNLCLSFLMIDIDNFKQYNDRYGHLVGDAILRQVSKIIRETVRQIDFIGRYGGEELCIVLTETDREQTNFAAERIRQEIAQAIIKVYDEKLRATVSIGASTFPDNANHIQDLIEKADQALYLAKESGKNKVCFSPVAKAI